MHGAARSPLVAVADVWVAVADVWAAQARGLAQIFAIAIGGIRSGLRGCVGSPRPRLWRMSGRGRAGAWSRSEVCYCGRD